MAKTRPAPSKAAPRKATPAKPAAKAKAPKPKPAPAAKPVPAKSKAARPAPAKPTKPSAKPPHPRPALSKSKPPVASAKARPAPAPPAPPPPPPPAPSPSPAPSPAKPLRERRSAGDLAKGQREISVSEFFEKNRHLLGFDNPAKALLTTVREAVDNALDACEEAGILPSIKIEIAEVVQGARYRVIVEDNGPGIVKAQIPRVFGKLLYGSKFHRLRQSRGQQGIGISAAGLYGLITTGKPVAITSRTGPRSPAHHFELVIDTKRNEPHVTVDTVLDEWAAEHGTRVEIELSASYKGGRRSVDEYVEQTALANPHAEFSYMAPRRGEPLRLPRVVEELPTEPETVKPHPHGVELGVFLRMARDAEDRTLHSVLTGEFSRVNAKAAAEILAGASFTPRARASSASREQLEALFRALQAAKLPQPSTTCVVPIGEPLVRKGLEREAPRAELYVTRTRPPRTYRGNVFMVEVGLAYGGEARSAYDAVTAAPSASPSPSTEGAPGAPPAPAPSPSLPAAPVAAAPSEPPQDTQLTIAGARLSPERRIDLGLLEIAGMTRAKAQELCHEASLDPLRKAGTLSEEELDRLRAAYEADVRADVASRPIELVRLANRVPLQYQQSACAITQAVIDTNWKRYGLTQPRGGMPLGPLVLVVHIASVWVPYTSESKEAIAHYPEIIEEIQRGLMECGRQLGAYLNRRAFERLQAARRDKIELYAGELVEALAFLTGRPKDEVREAIEVAKRKNIAVDDEPAEGLAKAAKGDEAAKGDQGPEEGA